MEAMTSTQFCGAIIVVSFFLKDVPMTQQSNEVPEETERVAGSEEGMTAIP